MLKPSRRVRRVLSYTVVPTTLLATGIFVSASSYSVFNATTHNPGNSWSAGTVALQADGTSGGSSGTALFSANVGPGSTGAKCITVTSNGTLPSLVKLYGANLSDQANLADWLTIGVKVGTATDTTGGACTGWQETGTVFPSAHLSTFPVSGYASGLNTGWTTSGTAGDSRVFRFDYTLDSAAPSSTQSGTAHVDFVWEAQSS